MTSLPVGSAPLIVTLVANLYLVSSQVVRLDQGSIKGTSGTSRNGTAYFSFLGIPYAKPPEGDLRFKSPQPHAGWSGERNGGTPGHDCPQRGNNYAIRGQEDCLYLNVNTPKLDPSAKLPVMVYIHGGAFKMGNGNYFKERFFMDRALVLVTLNYRLGILGFMSFLDPIIPGNVGLKDQIMALRWIQDNIEHFGGDPDQVTVFGGSAGAASVDYLVVSPLAKGLFHNAIIQSGTATSPWAFIPQHVARQRAEAVATLLGCPSKPTTDTWKCLKEIPMEDFVIAADKFLEWDVSPIGPFSPTIDSFLDPSEASIPDYPLALQPNPKINIILGFNSYEGNMIASVICFNDLRLAKELEADWSRRLALITCTQDQTKYDDKPRLATMLHDFYLDGRNITSEILHKFADMGTDLLFGHPSFKATLNYYRKVPVFFYLFDVEPRHPVISIYGNCTHLKGPSHGEEIIYFFNDIFPVIQLTPEEQKLSNKLLDLWVKFASTGVPSSDWSRVTSDSIDYLHMTETGFTMKKGLYEDRMRFVDTLPLITNQYNLRHEKTEL